MKIWFISDTHTQHEGLEVSDVDCVVHCGDEANDRDAELNADEAHDFLQWYSALDIETKLFVPGNHSIAIEQNLICPADYPAINFLCHQQLEIDGVRFFGTPFTPRFFDWAYMKERSELDLAWSEIPSDIEILITHGPPQGILDTTYDWSIDERVSAGCSALRQHVEQRIRPAIHAFGHMHDEVGIANFGRVTRGPTTFVNCSVCDLAGRLKNNGHIIHYQPRVNSP